MASKKTGDNGLNPKQEKFCLNYVTQEFFANGVKSYADAYGIDLTKPGKYQQAQVSASDLLLNPMVLKRINELLDLAGLNDAFVDKQLTFVIMQNSDLGSKVAAIREYNKLRQRITDKMKVEHTGNIISGITVNIVKPNNDQGTGT